MRILSFCTLFYTLFRGISALTTSGVPQRVALKGLDNSKFKHPLDQDLTSFIQKLPGVNLAEEALRRSFPIIEQGVRLDLLSSAVKTSSKQLPNLHNLLTEACEVLDLTKKGGCEVPELYVQSSAQANAYTLALQGRDTPPIVVVTSALLDRCTDQEIQAIIGHELGHLKCEHSLYLTIGGLASTPLRNLPFLGNAVDSVLQRWRLAAEYTCDRAALLVAQDSNVVAGALIKLFAGTSKYSLSTDAFIAQCVEYDELLKNANPLVRGTIQRQQRTHPLPIRRVSELEKWAKSDEYASILRNGVGIIDKKSEKE
mmetsp:Transcript_19212/g.24732  ORF Transcript_19212/g.24732 Transcript_19212/m.24732 type:complete len:313 (-) Transcript_19212:281-1219(-)|eukprot:CAMPEP_0198148164 /NCGR_PEP_ID=MMETSP1443-20131203/40201_1 /TAXON_ID=186043 /ORGANISM="Entomoneis sp., Strain CCMP2396" /LENGTH=312 /DNA_ID=CAMNT_0043812781 /DNA_START=130 /DNA_END=1068 /DNA_ORIENTATION=+